MARKNVTNTITAQTARIVIEARLLRMELRLVKVKLASIQAALNR